MEYPRPKTPFLMGTMQTFPVGLSSLVQGFLGMFSHATAAMLMEDNLYRGYVFVISGCCDKNTRVSILVKAYGGRSDFRTR